MIKNSSLLLALLLGSGLAAAQNQPPTPGINRNPAYREQLPPNPVPPPDARDTVVPNPGPGDPRDSDTRPVSPPAVTDGRETVIPGSASTGPANPVTPAPGSTRP
ncbi:hypothetical protein [Polaromonas sp.]|uniref:hypothetical protein n=1 Tax=Polaromonas sp. TaxID=1869339 RepID=UPI00248836ED|nr:hypothetical protein [Polaromonas sp.]MDI1274942.1 hypothetical protein [Polaromonas sp.]